MLPNLSALALTPTEVRGAPGGLSRVGVPKRRRGGIQKRPTRYLREEDGPALVAASSEARAYELLRNSQPSSVVEYVWKTEGKPGQGEYCKLRFMVAFGWYTKHGKPTLALNIQLLACQTNEVHPNANWHVKIDVMQWTDWTDMLRRVAAGDRSYMDVVTERLHGETLEFKPSGGCWLAGQACPGYGRMAARYIMATSDILQQLFPTLESVTLVSELAISDFIYPYDLLRNIALTAGEMPESTPAPTIVNEAIMPMIEKTMWRLTYYVNRLGAIPNAGSLDAAYAKGVEDYWAQLPLNEEDLREEYDDGFHEMEEREMLALREAIPFSEAAMAKYRRVGKMLHDMTEDTRETAFEGMFETAGLPRPPQWALAGPRAPVFDLPLLHAKELLLARDSVAMYDSRTPVVLRQDGAWLPSWIRRGVGL